MTSHSAGSNHSHRKWSLAEEVSITFTNHCTLLLSITSALLMMLRFTSSPSEWGLIGVAKRRRGSGNSDRYPNPPRGAASPPASFALVVGDGAVASRVPVFSRLPTHSASQHSTPRSIGAPNRPADDAAVTANARERASDTTRGRGHRLQICGGPRSGKESSEV